jgi:hypothetical protein
LDSTNSNKSTHPDIFGENPPVTKKLQPFEMMIKSANIRTNAHSQVAQHLLVHATSYHKNIKVLALGDPHTALLDTVESESCNYESESTDTVDSSKGSVDPHMNGTWQAVKSEKSHH